MTSIDSLASLLSVSAESLSELGATRNGQAWHFPERNGDGEVVGTARRFDDGRKGFVQGGKRGLTMAWPLPPYAGTSPTNPILIVEGASDTAAGMDLGFVPIGRPSATGGLAYLQILLRDLHVVIVGENDAAGRRGAMKLAKGLRGVAASVRVIFPPGGAKDLREWYTAPVGCTRDELLALIGRAEPIQPDRPAIVEPSDPYPVDVLPEPVRVIIQAVSRMIGSDPVFAALPAMTMLAGLIGTTRKLMIQRGHYAVAVLWAAVIARSGTAKSPAADPIFTALMKLQRKRMREYQAAIEEYQRQVIAFRGDVKQYEAARRKGDAVDPPTEPERPVQIRYLVRDTTIEGLCALLADNPRGLIHHADELSGWLGAFDRYSGGRGGSDRAQWLSIYDAREVIVDRKSAEHGKPIYVPAAAVSVYGTIQPGIAKRLLDRDDRDSGLVARLLLVRPPSRALRWTGRDLPEDVEQRWGELNERLLTLEHETDPDGEPMPRLVRLTADSRQLYAVFYDEQADRWERADSDDLAAAISKLRAIAARLALVIHLVRWAAGEPVDCDTVDADSMRSAITLARWHTCEAERVYAALSESEEDADRRRLVEWIERRGGDVSVRDLTHGLQRFRNASDAAQAALDDLAAAGLGRWGYLATGPKGGAPSKRFQIESGVTVTKTPDNGYADDGIGDGDSRAVHKIAIDAVAAPRALNGTDDDGEWGEV